MNSDAEKGGRGERRYLRLGREESVALPGEESWLDELEAEDEDDVADEEERGRKLVDDLLEDWEEEATMLELRERETPTPTNAAAANNINSNNSIDEKDDEQQASRMKGEERERSETPTPSPSPRCDDSATRSSSIWEDGEGFWHSTPPHPPNSPNKPKQRFLPLSSSPLSTSKASRKREFEVAKDDTPLRHKPEEEETDRQGEGGTAAGNARKAARSKNRKRSILGIGTPNVNVKIMVQPPSGSFTGTPGSLYDQDGFLQ